MEKSGRQQRSDEGSSEELAHLQSRLVLTWCMCGNQLSPFLFLQWQMMDVCVKESTRRHSAHVDFTLSSPTISRGLRMKSPMPISSDLPLSSSSQ